MTLERRKKWQMWLLISSSIVQPQNINQSSRAKIHLTPFDLNMLYFDYSPRGLLFHKPNPETHFISGFKSSLSFALEIYFPFAGRLVKVDNLEDKTVSYYIDYDDSSGVKFDHAEFKSLSVSDILKHDGYVPDFMDISSHFSTLKAMMASQSLCLLYKLLRWMTESSLVFVPTI